MALSSFPAFSGKCTPSAGRCFLVFLVSVLGVCVSVYYHFTPGIPFDRNLFAALGMLPGAILCRTPPAPALRGLAFLAVPHALVRRYCTDILLFQGNEYRHIPRSRMGCTAGSKHLLPPVHVLQHTERQGGKRLRQRQPTPRFRRNECPKEVAVSGRTALHSTDAVRFPFFAGYPSGNPHTTPNDGGCTPPHTKPLFRAAPGDGRQSRNACATQRSPETITAAFGGDEVDASHDSKLGRGNVLKKRAPSPIFSPSTAPRPSARLRGRPPDGPALRGRGKAQASHSDIRDAEPRSGGPAIPQAPDLPRRQGRGRP
mgnify:CR=1 FL=1